VTFANTTILGGQTWNANDGTDSAVVDFSAFSSDVVANHRYYATDYFVGSQYDSFSSFNYLVNLLNVENVTIYGGSGNDNLGGASGDNTLIGNDGNDNLATGSGNDYLSGGEDNDNLSGGGGNDILIGGPGDDTLTGGSEADIFRFLSLADLSANTDHITDFDPLADTIDLSGVGGLSFIGSAAFSGISGQVRYEFENLTTHILIDSDGDSVSDKRIVIDNGTFELVQTASGSNLLEGNSPPTGIALSEITIPENSANGTVVGSLSASDPNEGDAFTFTLLDDAGGRFAISGATLVVAGALDYETSMAHSVTVQVTDLGGETYNETFNIAVIDVFGVFTGTAGNDVLPGSSEEDTISGLAGADTISGLGGNDTIDGGTGMDTGSYSASPAGVTVSLATGLGSGGDAQGDTLQSIENLLGSAFADTLTGNAGNNTITGGGGADTISGGLGADTLNGGAGGDSLTGGAGADRVTGGMGADQYMFSSVGDFATGFTLDRIMDFNRTQGDKINLAAIDANSIVGGDQPFTFIGAGAFTGVAGQLGYTPIAGGVRLRGDINGDGVADFSMNVIGSAPLVVTDFVL
jgi:Ca2+-binding RTX toxin-like protein